MDHPDRDGGCYDEDGIPPVVVAVVLDDDYGTDLEEEAFLDEAVVLLDLHLRGRGMHMQHFEATTAEEEA